MAASSPASQALRGFRMRAAHFSQSELSRTAQASHAKAPHRLQTNEAGDPKCTAHARPAISEELIPRRHIPARGVRRSS